MQQRELVIRGGEIVTSHGIKEADIWIADGKIRRIAKDTLPKTSDKAPPVEVDATGMYLLPGFVAIADNPATRSWKPAPYAENMRELVRFGYTCMLDTLYPESWMDKQQIEYQKTLHYNSWIDYVWEVGVEASRFREKEVREFIKMGYSLIHITVRELAEISCIDWETISPMLTSYKTMLHLHIPFDLSVNREQRERIRREWLETTRYWKLRTLLPDHPSQAHAAAIAPFYHTFVVKGESTDQTLRQIQRNWFYPWPVAADLRDVRVDLRRRWCEREELLCMLVRLTSANAAKAVGLYPRKGSITPGADADLVFLKKENWLTKYDLSTILNFSECQLPTSVMSNGKWLYRDMRLISSIGTGRCLFDSKPYAYVI